MEFGGVDLLDSDRKTYNILKDQDGLYIFTPKKLTGPIKPKLSGR
jgi:mannitol 2-dehydrogenase